MEHSLHIATKHFIESISPRSRKKANNEDVGEDSNSEDEDELEAGDSLGKALALVKQVSFLLVLLTHFPD
jgi:hypothetical protein